MDRPRLYVDFNEMLDANLVLLSKCDFKTDSDGQKIWLHDGLKVYLYMEDINDNGEKDNLIAEGVVVKNHHEGWGKTAKWCCLINNNGIRHEKDAKARKGPKSV